MTADDLARAEAEFAWHDAHGPVIDDERYMPVVAARRCAAWQREQVPSVDDLARPLRDHSPRRREYSSPGFGCWGCDWVGDSSAHATHQAEVIRAHLTGVSPAHKPGRLSSTAQGSAAS